MAQSIDPNRSIEKRDRRHGAGANMTIKDALLYVSPAPGGEMTASFAAGLAQHFGTEVTGLTFAFGVAYPAGLYTRLPDELFQKLREKSREDASHDACKRHL
jgi:hypothetical protein